MINFDDKIIVPNTGVFNSSIEGGVVIFGALVVGWHHSVKSWKFSKSVISSLLFKEPQVSLFKSREITEVAS